MINTDNLQGNVLMLDLASPEVNRGSFCYLSYLLYSGFVSPATKNIESVQLHEEFRISDLENIQHVLDTADYILVGLWSYPQIDQALLLNRFLKGKCYFYGYYPLIQTLGLKPIYYTEETLMRGLRLYPYKVAANTFQYDLLSDCDKHIKGDNDTITGKMVPMFTSYGCPLGCTFCSATVNCNKHRTVMDFSEVMHCLDNFQKNGRLAVHLTDEDFFFDAERALDILFTAYQLNPNFQFIALGGMLTVNKFCDLLATKAQIVQDQVWQVLRLIEIGLETVDPALAKAMGKGGRSGVLKANLVGSKVRCKVLWLTVTFFPGETIGSLNATGEFLREHGLQPDEMEERIVTNGTEGGLGQFFQYYEGAGLTMQEYEESGVVLSGRPMRLIPSFVPHSFLESKFTVDLKAWDNRVHDLMYWFGVYGINRIPERFFQLIQDLKVNNLLYAEITVMSCLDTASLISYSNSCICIAIMARLGILQAV